MRTLKISVIAALLFLFAIPATAANYPPEMPDIQNAPIQFVCKTSSWFIKLYKDKEWEVSVFGNNGENFMIIQNKGVANGFMFVPSADKWKKNINLSKQERGEWEKTMTIQTTLEEAIEAMLPCIESNLHSRELR